MAEIAVAEALHEAIAAQDGVDPGPITDRCLLGVVRWTLELHEDLRPPDDDDFTSSGAWMMRRLPVDQRVPLALSVHPGLDEAETARLLGTSPRVVRRRLRKGRAALAGLLGDVAAGDHRGLEAALRGVSRSHRIVRGASPAPVTVPLVRRDRSTTGATFLAGRSQRATQIAVVAATGAAVTAVAALTGLLAPSPGSDSVVLATRDVAPVVEPAVPQLLTPQRSESPKVTTAPPVPGATATTVATGRRSATRPAAGPASPGDDTQSSTRASTSSPQPRRSPTATTPRPPVHPPGLVVGRSSGLCLDAGTDSSGYRPVRLGSCTAGGGQLVRRTETGTLTLAGGCVDAHDFDTSPGTAVLVSGCHGLSNQQWTVGADGTIVGVGSNLCVAPEGGGSEAGTPLVLAPCDGSPHTRWDWT